MFLTWRTRAKAFVTADELARAFPIPLLARVPDVGSGSSGSRRIRLLTVVVALLLAAIAAALLWWNGIR
jgi:hypothetical protein